MTSGQRFQSFAVNHIEHLERDAARLFLTNFPLPEGRWGDIHVFRKNSLAGVALDSYSFDLCWAILRNLWQAERIELSHCGKVHHTSFVEVSRRLVNGLQNVAGLACARLTSHSLRRRFLCWSLFCCLSCCHHLF